MTRVATAIAIITAIVATAMYSVRSEIVAIPWIGAAVGAGVTASIAYVYVVADDGQYDSEPSNVADMR